MCRKAQGKTVCGLFPFRKRRQRKKRRIFSIPISPGYTDGSQAFLHRIKPPYKVSGIIVIPSAAGAAPPLKGREQKHWKTAQTLSIQPLSQNLRFCQLPLHRGAEKCSVNAFPRSPIQPLSHGVLILNRRASSPCTGEPRFAPGRRGAELAQGSRETPCKPSVRVFRRGAEARTQPGAGLAQGSQEMQRKRFPRSPMRTPPPAFSLKTHSSKKYL